MDTCRCVSRQHCFGTGVLFVFFAILVLIRDRNIRVSMLGDTDAAGDVHHVSRLHGRQHRRRTAHDTRQTTHTSEQECFFLFCLLRPKQRKFLFFKKNKGVFLPAFSFTLIGHNLFERIVDLFAVRAVLDGITAW